MIPAASTRPHDCLLVCVASVLEVDPGAIAYGDVFGDWQGAWDAMQGSLRELGWQLVYHEVDPPTLLEAELAGADHVGYWIAGVTCPSWPPEWSHALLVRGSDVVLYPATGLPDVPRDELVLRFVFRLAAIDPARFVTRERFTEGVVGL